MNMLLIAQLFALAGVVAGAYGIYRRYQETSRRALPGDRSAPKGDPHDGIAYAFTSGMMPWAKESTRIHAIAYLRGIAFHVGIFTALGAVALSPFWTQLPSLLMDLLFWILVAGSLLGGAGGVMRLAEHNLRGLSLPDDHFAVWLTSLFIGVTALGLILPALRPAMYFLAGLTLIYIPLGKVRHCLYFFFSRTFFGKFFGRRAVLPHPQPVE
jgi:hypothetical protein